MVLPTVVHSREDVVVAAGGDVVVVRPYGAARASEAWAARGWVGTGDWSV